MFQSLIGRLKTYNGKAVYARKRKFQSLIGRLKTIRKGNTRLAGRKVSIPYR